MAEYKNLSSFFCFLLRALQAVQFVRKALGQGQNLDDIAAGLVDRAIQR